MKRRSVYIATLLFASMLPWSGKAQQLSIQEQMMLKQHNPELLKQIEKNNRRLTLKATMSQNVPSSLGSIAVKYMPAPGQFTNEAIGKADAGQKLVNGTGSMVSLGGWGGYIQFEFTGTIRNRQGNPYGVDFTVKGNAFGAAGGGSWSEPGAVMVRDSADGNWYELAGSSYYFVSAKHNISMTYANPKYDARFAIPWETNQTAFKGVMSTNTFHNHPYYPDPFDDWQRRDGDPANALADNLTLQGSYIPLGIDMSQPNYITIAKQPKFGYADNYPNNNAPSQPRNPYYPDAQGAQADGFDISWAVNPDGTPRSIAAITGIRIYNATQYNAGWLGEISTEVCGFDITAPGLTYGQGDYYVNAIDPTQVVVQRGKTCQFYGLLFKNGKPHNLGSPSWRLSNTAVGTINPTTGLFSATATGTTKIYFKRGNYAAEDSISIDVVNLIGMELRMEGFMSAVSNDTVRLYTGERNYIIAQSIDDRTGQRNRFVYDTYTWTSGNTGIAAVQNGMVTAVAPGTTTITATSQGNTALSDNIVVIVTAPPALTQKITQRAIHKDTLSVVLTVDQLFNRTGQGSIYLKSATSANPSCVNASIQNNKLAITMSSIDCAATNITLVAQYYGVNQTFNLEVKPNSATIIIQNATNGQLAVFYGNRRIGGTITVPLGMPLRIYGEPASGYKLKQIKFGNRTYTSSGMTVPVIGSATITAEFVPSNTPLVYAVNFAQPANGTITVTQGGNPVSSGTTFATNTAITISATPSAGYHTAVLKVNDVSFTSGGTHTIAGDVAIQAVMDINTYTLRYRTDTLGFIVGDTLQHVPHGGNGTPVQLLPWTTTQFDQWSDGSTANPRTDLNVQGNIDVFASYVYTRSSNPQAKKNDKKKEESQPSLLHKVTATPNPFNSEVTLYGAETISTYALYNTQGQLMLKGKHDGSTLLRLKVQSLPKGAYLLLLTSPKGEQRTIKLMK